MVKQVRIDSKSRVLASSSDVRGTAEYTEVSSAPSADPADGPTASGAQDLGGVGLAELAHDVAEQPDHRPVRQPAAVDRDAGAPGDEGIAVPGPPAELVDQPRLADPGIAADEHGGGPTTLDLVEDGAQLFELAAPPDELRGRHPMGHRVRFAPPRTRVQGVQHGGPGMWQSAVVVAVGRT